MAKIRLRITRTQVIDYEADPGNYPEDFTPEQMLETDLDGAKQDSASVFEDTRCIETITGEVVK